MRALSVSWRMGIDLSFCGKCETSAGHEEVSSRREIMSSPRRLCSASGAETFAGHVEIEPGDHVVTAQAARQ